MRCCGLDPNSRKISSGQGFAAAFVIGGGPRVREQRLHCSYKRRSGTRFSVFTHSITLLLLILFIFTQCTALLPIFKRYRIARFPIGLLPHYHIDTDIMSWKGFQRGVVRVRNLVFVLGRSGSRELYLGKQN